MDAGIDSNQDNQTATFPSKHINESCNVLNGNKPRGIAREFNNAPDQRENDKGNNSSSPFCDWDTLLKSMNDHVISRGILDMNDLSQNNMRQEVETNLTDYQSESDCDNDIVRNWIDRDRERFGNCAYWADDMEDNDENNTSVTRMMGEGKISKNPSFLPSIDVQKEPLGFSSKALSKSLRKIPF